MSSVSNIRAVQRWRAGAVEDRPGGPLHRPSNGITDQQRRHVLALLMRRRFRELSPKQIVPTLADEDVYTVSEATMYRLLRSEWLLTHRANLRPRTHHRPPELMAGAPNMVWCWDITYLRALVRGIFYYLYLLEDLYSRRIVGWQVLDGFCSLL